MNSIVVRVTCSTYTYWPLTHEKHGAEHAAMRHALNTNPRAARRQVQRCVQCELPLLPHEVHALGIVPIARAVELQCHVALDRGQAVERPCE